jgi:lysophospholipase L1-like esterase
MLGNASSCSGLAFAILLVGLPLTGRARAQAPPLPDTRPTLFLVGDSTMADKPVIPANAERGWGQMLPAFFRETLRIENHAVNGRSSKSFLAEDRWAAITNKLRPGDWVIVQFGHNDEKRNDPKRFTEPFGEFKSNLERYLVETRVHGATPILATPVVRRSFDADGQLKDTHGDYVKALREVAADLHAPLLELNARSAEIVQALGPERSKKLYLWVGPDEFPALEKAKEDDTHFCAYGATRICDLAVAEIQKAAPELGRFLNTRNGAH